MESNLINVKDINIKAYLDALSNKSFAIIRTKLAMVWHQTEDWCQKRPERFCPSEFHKGVAKRLQGFICEEM